MLSIKQFQAMFAFHRYNTGDGRFGVILNGKDDNNFDYVRMVHRPTICPTYGHVIEDGMPQTSFNGATSYSVTVTDAEGLALMVFCFVNGDGTDATNVPVRLFFPNQCSR